jgi:hypothetical protein
VLLEQCVVERAVLLDELRELLILLLRGRELQAWAGAHASTPPLEAT